MLRFGSIKFLNFVLVLQQIACTTPLNDDDSLSKNQGPHLCIITSHPRHLGPNMKTCAATEHAARAWLEAGGNESTSSYQEVKGVVFPL